MFCDCLLESVKITLVPLASLDQRYGLAGAACIARRVEHRIVDGWFHQYLVARLTDGRFSGPTRGLMVGHVAPEAVKGGPIAAVRNGDMITLDIDDRSLNVDLPVEEIDRRIEAYKIPEPLFDRGVMAKYARGVSSASLGAVT